MIGKTKLCFGISLILLGLNLFLFLDWLLIHPMRGYLGPYWCMIPMLFVLPSVGWTGVFIISIIFIGAIATTVIRLYQVAIIFSLLGGILTIPLGSLGIISSIFIWYEMKIPRCPFCGEGVEKDKRIPFIGICLKCRRIFLLRHQR